MKTKNNYIKRTLLGVLLLMTPLIHNFGQDKNYKKAWEFGLGGSVSQFSRTSFSNFSQLENGYQFDMRLSHVVWGGNIYIARELNPYFYLDIQGDIGFTKKSLFDDGNRKWFYNVGPGLQWRFGEYFGSKYIEPYLRAGVNYMRKNFEIAYMGTEGLSPDDMTWVMENIKNKDGKDRKDLVPIALGVGLNTWLNNRFGIGLQGDYLIMPYAEVANSIQGTVRLMYRLGGKSKKPTPTIEYREIERIVKQPPVEVEKIIEVPVEVPSTAICELFSNIHFEFDKSILLPESRNSIKELAIVLKEDTAKRYLVTGYTDAKGSQYYNENLSLQRAKTVVDALIDEGVPSNMLKFRGVGKKVAYADNSASSKVRQGDRKVIVELVTNQDYWNYLK